MMLPDDGVRAGDSTGKAALFVILLKNSSLGD